MGTAGSSRHTARSHGFATRGRLVKSNLHAAAERRSSGSNKPRRSKQAPVLQQYVKAVSVVRPFFDVTPESAVDAFVREAPAHPVFRLIPAAATSK